MNSKRKALVSLFLIIVSGFLYFTCVLTEDLASFKSEKTLANTNEVIAVRGSSPLSINLNPQTFVGGATLPEIRTRVRQQIEHLVGDPAKPDLDVLRFRRVFEAFVHPTLTAAVRPVNPDHEIGKTLAEGFNPFGSEALTIFAALQEKGEVPFASGPIEQESLLGMFSILMIQAGAGGREIPGTLEGLASRLPPTRADYLVSVAAREALQAVNRTSGPLHAEELVAWKRLAGAQNPVYRGLALLGAPRVCTDQEQLTSIYFSFRHESDPELFRRAIDRLSLFTHSDAQSALKEIREDVLKAGRSKLLSALDNALLQQAEAVAFRSAYENK